MDEMINGITISEGDFPKCTVSLFNRNKSSLCVLSFEEPDLVGPAPVAEDFSTISDSLPTEIIIDKYTKHSIKKKDKSEDTDDEEEDFDWYNPDSASTYACLTHNNTM